MRDFRIIALSHGPAMSKAERQREKFRLREGHCQGGGDKEAGT
jgi:hypothetical protein